MSHKNLIDLTGMQFGRLTVVSRATNRGRVYWNCLCKCGNEKTIAAISLRGKITFSCGCLRIENSTTHGYSVKNNGKMTFEYSVWKGIRTRCYQVNHHSYKRYGGRGITMCDRWRGSFENFLSDMGIAPSSKHSIERLENDGNYEPSNCKWATCMEQARNKRNNRHFEHNGIRMIGKDWAKYFGVCQRSFMKHINRQKRSIAETYEFYLKKHGSLPAPPK